MLELILIILVILFLLGAVPVHTRYGLGGSSIVTILAIVILVVLLARLL